MRLQVLRRRHTGQVGESVGLAGLVAVAAIVTLTILSAALRGFALTLGSGTDFFRRCLGRSVDRLGGGRRIAALTDDARGRSSEALGS